MGPVTGEEYESREERYDKQLAEKYGVDITGKAAEEKVAVLRKFRERQYEELKDAVYERRGWNKDGIPTVETVKRLGIDFPEVLEVLRDNAVGS
jgi:aldehyde:ferredoxin oxidoreductase